MFLNNYGVCAIFLKEKTLNLDVDDYRYSTQDRIVTLEEYISPSTTVTVPTPTIG